MQTAGPTNVDNWVAFFQTPFVKEGVKFTYESEIHKIVNTYPDRESLDVDYMDIHYWDDEKAEKLLIHPDDEIRDAEKAIVALCPADARCEIRFRPYNIIEKSSIFDMRDQPGHLVSVEAIVRTVRQKRKMCTNAMFKCARCGEEWIVAQDPREYRDPYVCANESCGKPANQTTFKLIQEKSEFVDVEVDAIEDLRDVVQGPEPYLYEIFMTEDLCQRIIPGQRIIITGIVRLKQKKAEREKTPIFDPYLWGVSVESLDERYDLIVLTKEDIDDIQELAKKRTLYQDLRKMIAPFIFGMDDVKEAILHQLFGGVEKFDTKGYRVRPDIHIFLVGDPGTGKSQILKHVAKISPKGIYCSGKSASGVGLTAACQKEEGGGWVIIAGALPIADRGICCIQEDQRVLTTHGPKAIKDIEIGDKVINTHKIFKGCSVLGKIDNGYRETMKLHLYDGNTIECTSDHKILTWDGWVEAQQIKEGDYIKIPAYYGKLEVDNKREYELGFIHGFGLADIYTNEKSKKNGLAFTASVKNKERSTYVDALIAKHYRVPVHIYNRPESTVVIYGKPTDFTATETHGFSSKKLKGEMLSIFHENRLASDSVSYKLGFLAGLMSTDCNISHKKGKFGIKHCIQLGIGRAKYDEAWCQGKMRWISSMFQNMGIMSVCRGRIIYITSLRSYNRCVELFAGLLHGAKASGLYPVVAISQITSDDSILDKEYFKWFSELKFNTSYSVKAGWHSRIWYSINKRKVITDTLMETLRPHWPQLCDAPFREPNKTYLLNKVLKIENNPTPQKVYDLTVNEEPSFMIEGGVVHNCVDEIDKMDENDLGSIHEALEQQTISIQKIAKAQLNCRCAVLAAANPKDGRFDPQKPLIQQVDMDAVLLSRFGLIYVITDDIDATMDRAKADYIVNYAQDLSKISTNTMSIEVQEAQERLKLPISYDLLKKYIAYAKQNIKPVINDDVKKSIIDYYVAQRQEGARDTLEGEHRRVVMTTRQIEDLERLTEASARIRLSDTATMEDVDRAIRIHQSSVNKVARDDKGHIDIDLIMTGNSARQRDLAGTMINLIAAESRNYTNGVPTEELIQYCVNNHYFSEERARETIEILLRNGDILCPRTNTLIVNRK